MTDESKVNLTPKTLEEAIEIIGHLAKIIIELKEENARLKEQLNTNSKNSSLPPSRDLKKKKQNKPKSGRFEMTPLSRPAEGKFLGEILAVSF